MRRTAVWTVLAVITAMAMMVFPAMATAGSLVGDTHVEGVSDGGGGTSEAFGYQATATGTVTDAEVYLTSTSGVRIGVYSDTSRKPNVLLTRGTVTSNTAGWVDVPLNSSVDVTAGTYYWIAIASRQYSSVFYRDVGSSGSSLDYSGAGLQSPYVIRANWSSNPASVYLMGSSSPPPPPALPANTSPPTISGTPQQGATLTASNGSWTGTAPISYSYQWQDNGQSISGANSQTYVPTSSDVGNEIDVVVTATNTAGFTSATSASVGPVSAPPPPPQNTALPAISGTAQAGDQLTTTNGSWSNSPSSYDYQWQNCSNGSCTNINGATGSSYVLQASDVGDTIDIVVTAKNGGGSTPATSAQTAAVTAAPGFSPLHVSGVNLENASNQPIFLHGANRAGTEYTCMNGGGFFDGTSSTDFSQEDAQIGYMGKWGINGEMITLNEDCWLGINGSPTAYSNSSSSPPTPGCSASQCPYANAIENIVQTDEANHIYPVISLMFAQPGTNQSRSHENLLDNDHAPLFWEEVADFFKNDPYVMFRLEQEPQLWYGNEQVWQCWAQGDVSYGTGSDNTPPKAPTPTGTPDTCANNGSSIGYTAVGMQSTVNIVRGTGSHNIILLPGLQYSNMLSCGPSTSPVSCGMLDSATPPVTDPLTPAQLVASVDVYPEGNECGQQLDTSCYDATYKPVAQVMPLVAGETAENPNNIYLPTTYADMFMKWMDTNANGYFPYAWDPWADLIPGYGDNSAPSTTWGTDYYNHIHGSTPTR